MTYLPQPGVAPSRNPTHPRFRTDEQIEFGRFVVPRLSKARCFNVYSPEMTRKQFEMKAKNGGPRFYRVEVVYRQGHIGEPPLVVAGQRLVRITRDGEPMPRARKTEPGVSGKSVWRRFRKELRDERRANDTTA
jgi:hypothetical protein